MKCNKIYVSTYKHIITTCIKLTCPLVSFNISIILICDLHEEFTVVLPYSNWVLIDFTKVLLEIIGDYMNFTRYLSKMVKSFISWSLVDVNINKELIDIAKQDFKIMVQILRVANVLVI